MDSPSSRRPIPWPTAAPDYKLHKRIGNGAFSSVWKATCSSNSIDVAIKIMDLEHITTSFEDILQEVQTMRLCEDEHVLRCFCSFVQKDQLWLITELMDRGSCLRVMNIARHYGFGEGMNEEWLAYILLEALQGLRYLHENGQIHRDIKSGNILLDAQGNVRIADFGVSGWTLARGQRQETVKTFVGTPCWMAPEVMEQLEGYDYRADIWSFGITALELAKGNAPYAKYPPMRVLVLTIEEDPPSLKTYDSDRQRTGAPFSRNFEDFVRKCLQKSPKSRPSADDLLKHKFLNGRTKDALLHQLLDHLPAVGIGDDPDQDDDGDSMGSSASFLRDAGSIGSKNSFNSREFDGQSSDSTSTNLNRRTSSGVFSNLSGSPPFRSGTSKVSFGNSVDAKISSDSSNVTRENSCDKDFVSGTTWVFDSSPGESGVFSEERGGKSKPPHTQRKHRNQHEEDDVGEFLDGFDRETATIKTTSGATTDSHNSNNDNPSSCEDDLGEHQYNMPRDGSLVMLDCGSMVSSLNSLGNDDIVVGLIDGGREGTKLLGTAKETIFEFDDRRKSEELMADPSFGPGPLLNSMDNKMVSSLDGNETLERLIGSGLHKKIESNSSASTMKESNINEFNDMKEDEEEDMDVFLDGFEEETADMNF